MPYLYIDGAYQYIDGVYYYSDHFPVILDADRTGTRIFHFHFSPVENGDTMKLPFIRACLFPAAGVVVAAAAFFDHPGRRLPSFFCALLVAKKKSKNRLL